MDEPVAGCSPMIRAQMLAVAEKARAPNYLNEERLPFEHAGETTLRIGTECAHPLDSRSGLPPLRPG
jgi:hypothetical protein